MENGCKQFVLFGGNETWISVSSGNKRSRLDTISPFCSHPGSLLCAPCQEEARKHNSTACPICRNPYSMWVVFDCPKDSGGVPKYRDYGCVTYTIDTFPMQPGYYYINDNELEMDKWTHTAESEMKHVYYYLRIKPLRQTPLCFDDSIDDVYVFLHSDVKEKMKIPLKQIAHTASYSGASVDNVFRDLIKNFFLSPNDDEAGKTRIVEFGSQKFDGYVFHPSITPGVYICGPGQVIVYADETILDGALFGQLHNELHEMNLLTNTSPFDNKDNFVAELKECVKLPLCYAIGMKASK
jgi:hypothetical protein